MFWTKFIRCIAFILLIMMIATFCYMYIEPIIDIIEDDPASDLEKFVVLSGASSLILIITILGGVLMVSEISINTQKMLEKMKNNYSETSIKASEQSTKTWVCTCGTRNAESSTYCKNCGTKK